MLMTQARMKHCISTLNTFFRRLSHHLVPFMLAGERLENWPELPQIRGNRFIRRNARVNQAVVHPETINLQRTFGMCSGHRCRDLVAIICATVPSISDTLLAVRVEFVVPLEGVAVPLMGDGH